MNQIITWEDLFMALVIICISIVASCLVNIITIEEATNKIVAAIEESRTRERVN